MRVIGNLQVHGPESIIRLNPNPQNNLEYSGYVMEDIVGMSVIAGQALYYDIITSSWKVCQANSSSTIPCRGLALETKSINDLCLILKMGTVKFDSWNFTDNNKLYVSATTAGLITHVQPNQSGNIVQIIGVPLKNNVGYFDFCPTAVELA